MRAIKSKIGRKFEQKRKAKWVKEKANLVKAYYRRPKTRVLCTFELLDGCNSQEVAVT